MEIGDRAPSCGCDNNLAAAPLDWLLARISPTSDPDDESSELSSDPEEAESESEVAFLDFFAFLPSFAAFLAFAFFMSLFSSRFSRA